MTVTRPPATVVGVVGLPAVRPAMRRDTAAQLRANR